MQPIDLFDWKWGHFLHNVTGTKGANKSIGNKKWDKYTKVKKAIKPPKGYEPLGYEPRSRIGSSASNSSLKLLDSGSETPPMKQKPKRNSSKKKKAYTTVKNNTKQKWFLDTMHV